jgi:hypothetical protein
MSSSNNLQRLRSINGNRARLLENVGFSSIRAYRTANPEFRNDNEAYQSLLGLYNDNIEMLRQQEQEQRQSRRQQARTERIIQREQSILAKQQSKATNKYIQGINNQLNTFEEHGISGNIKLDIGNFYGNIRAFLQGLKLGNKRLFLQSGNKRYVLNLATLHRLEELLSPYVVHSEEFVSGQEIITAIEETGNLSIGNILKQGENMTEGGLFPYTHNLDIDLSDYAVYRKSDNWGDLNNRENCFITALKSRNIDTTTAKEYIQNQYLCQRKLKELAPKLKLFIRVKRLYENGNISSRMSEYGNPTDPIIDLGLLDKHYFIIQPTIYTSFAIENYFQIKDQPNWEKITRIRDGIYRRDGDRFIDSYKLISILLENKQTHLNELEGNEIYKLLNWKEKEEPIYSCLKYNDTLYDRKENPSGELKHLTAKSTCKSYVAISYFDFETTTTRNDNEITKHKPYLCCNTKLDDVLWYEGSDCGKRMIEDLWREYSDDREAVEARKKIGVMEGEFDIDYPCVLLIAHNAGYDFRFILEYLDDIETIEKGNGLMMSTAYYTKKDYSRGRGSNSGRARTVKFEIRCSLKMINMPLGKFGKCFGMEIKKEIMPYSFYTEENIITKYFLIKDFLTAIPVKDHKEVITNIKKWKCYGIKNDYSEDKTKINIIKYSREYCKMDCLVLKKGYETFRRLCNDAIQLDPIDYISLASMADDYLKKECCYQGVLQICGVPRAFIQRCIVGGRTMIANNQKIHLQDKIINDFDAVSLYPTGMERMEGFLLGKPKVITQFTPDEYTSYFICIRIKQVGRRLRFPLNSCIAENGTRNFTNDLIGKVLYIDKTGLEDLIKYQQVEYEFINGYYYDEGYNPNIKTTIRHLFTQRLKYKRDDNPLQMVFKECMNSCYGKSYMKPIEKDIHYISVDEFEKFMYRQYNYIKEATLLDNGKMYKVVCMEKINQHFNYAHIGVEILSMTKRIMNEVMVLAEDMNIDLYYQDTDSIHIEDVNIQKLADAFKERNGRELIGKDMGQFHSDFDLGSAKNVVAIESIFLGKKCYCDKLRGEDENGDYVYGFHIRMKGVPEDSILYKAEMEYGGDVMAIYKDLFDGAELEFDLLAKKPKFELKSDMTIVSKASFIRKIKF